MLSLRTLVMVVAIVGSFAEEEENAVSYSASSVAYSKIIDVPIDEAKSILAFNKFHVLMPYLVVRHPGHPEHSFTTEYSDGDNVGSVRTITVFISSPTGLEKDPPPVVRIDTKIGEGENHYFYGIDDADVGPFHLTGARGACLFIPMSETQTLVAFKASYQTDDVAAAKAYIEGSYAVYIGAAETIYSAAAEQTFGWEVSYPSCTRGYWDSGCGQPAMEQTGTVKCYGMSADGKWVAEDEMCTDVKPAETTRTCPATEPCPWCKGCKRNGNCWKTCGKKAGKCSKCDSENGRKGVCCQPGNENNPIECQLAEFQFNNDDIHTCALLPEDEHMGSLLTGILSRLGQLEKSVGDLMN